MDTKFTKDKETIVEERVIRKVYDIEKLMAELREIDLKIKKLEKEPDGIVVPNDEKFSELEMLNERKEKINKLLSRI